MRRLLFILAFLPSLYGGVSIILEEEPSFDVPVCQLSTQAQFHSYDYRFWLAELHEVFRYHRKPWEFCYIAQVLYQNGALKAGQRGIGFGVGDEPLAALFAKFGCFVVATDQDYESAKAQGWIKNGEKEWLNEKINARGICDRTLFDQNVVLQSVDMRKISPDLFEQFDFVWSSCALEHLGSLKAGFDFIKESLKCLKPGGVAVHTTEYNLSSNTHTIRKGGTVLYRQKDIIRLALELERMGYEMANLNFHPGAGELDLHIDIPPYIEETHLKLQLGRYAATSVGLIIRKPITFEKK